MLSLSKHLQAMKILRQAQDDIAKKLATNSRAIATDEKPELLFKK